MLHCREDYNRRIQDAENIIPDDEPVFLLRAQDVFAPKLVSDWAEKMRQSGHVREANEADAQVKRMHEYQLKKNCKIPDMPDEEKPVTKKMTTD